MTKETVFIDAENGGISVYIGVGNKVGFAKTAKMLAYILDTKKFLVKCSSLVQWILLMRMGLTTMMVQRTFGKTL